MMTFIGSVITSRIDNTVKNLFERYKRFWLILLTLGAFAIAYRAPQFLPKGDARGTMLTAQQIIQHGTLQLDSYLNEFVSGGRLHYGIVKIGDHYYNYYPFGTSLLVSPLVGIANLFGLDMVNDDPLMQKLLLAWSLSCSSLLLYHLNRCHLKPLSSYLFTIGFTFGSAVSSTLGSALWSQNLHRDSFADSGPSGAV